MVFTESRDIKGKKYYYRVISKRKGDKIMKERVYLGFSLSPSELKIKEEQADKKLLAKKQIINKEIEKIKPKIIKILRENKVNKAGIFGSYARGEQNHNSDIDIVVNINNKQMSLLGFIRLKTILEKILKRKVDLVEYSALKPLIKEDILNDEIRII